jgi:hypothetical protein
MTTAREDIQTRLEFDKVSEAAPQKSAWTQDLPT